MTSMLAGSFRGFELECDINKGRGGLYEWQQRKYRPTDFQVGRCCASLVSLAQSLSLPFSLSLSSPSIVSSTYLLVDRVVSPVVRVAVVLVPSFVALSCRSIVGIVRFRSVCRPSPTSLPLPSAAGSHFKADRRRDPPCKLLLTAVVAGARSLDVELHCQSTVRCWSFAHRTHRRPDHRGQRGIERNIFYRS